MIDRDQRGLRICNETKKLICSENVIKVGN